MTTKELKNLRAQAALAGITLHSGTDHMGLAIYLASRWNLSRTFDALQDVIAWLDQETGAKKGESNA